MNIKRSILIVTNTTDMHADRMIIKLNELGHNPIRLNTDEIPLYTNISFLFNETNWVGSIRIMSSEITTTLDAIHSIWWRRPEKYLFPEDMPEQEKLFASGEIRSTLEGILGSLDCYWVSYFDNIRRASRKVEQLHRATQLGFTVPRTLVTTDPDQLSSFYDACNRQVIYKVLTDSTLATSQVKNPELRSVYTTLLTEEHLKDVESIRYSPCQFQELIQKQRELRITIIGDEVFAVEIDSQSSSDTELDWRRQTLIVPHRKAILPDYIASASYKLVKSYGLNYGAIDLIITPDEKYIFLELNPNGQFMWQEDVVPDLKMTDALASCLIRGANQALC